MMNSVSMSTGATISSLRAGDEVRGVFACVRKDRLRTRTGTPYLAGLFERGDLVSVVGRVERFREELTVEVSDIRRVATSGDSSEAQTVVVEQFLPVAFRDMEELDGFLEHLSREVYDPGYRALLDSILSDSALREAFRKTPCTRAGHHAYLGGLLEHTVAVATLARELCDLHRRLNSDLLITAAIVHDLGRMREFTYGAEIGLSEQGRLLGHLVLGQQMLSERFALLERQGGAEGAALDEDRKLALLHCVLSHHGASGAPGGRFASPEALALYRVNALDAGVKGALEHGLGASGE